MKIYNGILRILDSAKGTMSLLVLIFSTVAVLLARIDGVSYAAIMGTVSAIFMWTRHKTDIADLEHRTAIAEVEAKTEVADLKIKAAAQTLGNSAISQIKDNTQKIETHDVKIDVIEDEINDIKK